MNHSRSDDSHRQGSHQSHEQLHEAQRPQRSGHGAVERPQAAPPGGLPKSWVGQGHAAWASRTPREDAQVASWGVPTEVGIPPPWWVRWPSPGLPASLPGFLLVMLILSESTLGAVFRPTSGSCRSVWILAHAQEAKLAHHRCSERGQARGECENACGGGQLRARARGSRRTAAKFGGPGSTRDRDVQIVQTRTLRARTWPDITSSLHGAGRSPIDVLVNFTNIEASLISRIHQTPRQSLQFRATGVPGHQ